MKFTFILVVLVQVASLVSGQPGSCDNALNVCGNTLFMEIEAAGENISAVCRLVDDALGCVIRETASCDPMNKVNVIRIMGDFTGVYQQDPYNCSLSNANDAAFNDPCAEAVTSCDNIYYQALYAPPSEACQQFDEYLTCMKSMNTSTCGLQALETINGTITNATAKKEESPFFCSERKTYDIEGCEAGFYDCMSPLSVLYNNPTEIPASQQICSEVSTLMQCLHTISAKCSPRLQERNTELASNLTANVINDCHSLTTTATAPTTLPTTTTTTTTTTSASSVAYSTEAAVPTSVTTPRPTTIGVTTAGKMTLTEESPVNPNHNGNSNQIENSNPPISNQNESGGSSLSNQIVSGDTVSNNPHQNGHSFTNQNQNGESQTNQIQNGVQPGRMDQNTNRDTSNRNTNEEDDMSGGQLSSFAHLSGSSTTRLCYLTGCVMVMLTSLLT